MHLNENAPEIRRGKLIRKSADDFQLVAFDVDLVTLGASTSRSASKLSPVVSSMSIAPVPSSFPLLPASTREVAPRSSVPCMNDAVLWRSESASWNAVTLASEPVASFSRAKLEGVGSKA